MISLILLFPLIACLILFVLKNKISNDLMIIIHSLILLICSILLCIDINPYDINQKLFALNSINKIFLIILAIIYVAFSVYNCAFMRYDNLDKRKVRHYTYAVILFVLSMTGAILSTNLGINWVFIEATTLASAYLIYFNKTKHSIEAAWKYVFICSIGIALAFVGIIFLTVSTGSLNSLFYEELFLNATDFNPFWLKLSFVFILFGIGTKMGLAPVHFWLPDAYAQAPSPSSALISSTLLNCTFLMILNLFKIITIANMDDYARIMLLAMGFLSLFIAAVFVYHINNYKRMLAYSSIENMGIIIIGTALGHAGLVAAIIHLIGHSFAKASFFMSAGNIFRIYKTKKISSVLGVLSVDKKTGWLWVISFIAIMAFPPSILFVSEFMIIKTMLEQGHYIMCVFFLLLLTIVLYGIARAVTSMSFGKSGDVKYLTKLPWQMYFPQIVLLLFVFILGIFLPFSETIKNAISGF